MPSSFIEIKKFCQENLKAQQLWSTYYERRYLEFQTFYELLPQKKFLKILELGCGTGYYSAFLSQIADKVIATDLEQIDPLTHSPGLEITRNFLKTLNIQNVTVMHASADDLPFNDNSFDMVFSSHVLEHVPDVNKAVSEINRVLKPNGINFCVMPTSIDKVYGFFLFYVYILQRVIAKTGNLIFKKKNKSNEAASFKEEFNKNKLSYFKFFPFPPPHGAYPHYLTELRKWTYSGWRRVISNNGSIEVTNQYGLQSNPLLPLLGTTLPHVAVWLYSKTRRVENKLSQTLFIRNFGISTLIITRKK